MKRSRVIAFVASLLFALFAFASVFSGASYLQMILPGGLPFGNALTAIGLCSTSWAALLLTLKNKILRSVSLIALMASIAWLPVSIAMAGNLELNFTGSIGSTWLAASAFLFLSVMLVLFLALLFSLVALYRNRRAT